MSTPPNQGPDGSNQPYGQQEPYAQGSDTGASYGQAGSYSQAQPDAYGTSSGQAQTGAYGAPAAGGYSQQPDQFGQSAAPWGQGGALPRPGTVIAGCVLAWIGSALMIVLGLIILIAGGTLTASDLGLSGADSAGLMAVIGIFGGIFLVWGLIVVLGAVFAFRGAKWGRMLLTVLGAIFLVFGIMGLTTGEASGLIGVAWVAASTVLLWLPASTAWYNSKA